MARIVERLTNLFRPKRSRKLHFALVIADTDTAGFQFTPDKDCRMFMVTGEVLPNRGVPREVIAEAINRVNNPKPEGDVRITEKKI